MFCENCGAQIPEGAVFCARCGTPVPAPQPLPPVAAPQPLPAAGASGGMGDGNANGNGNAHSPALWVFAGVAGGIALIVAVAAFLYAAGVFGGRDSTELAGSGRQNHIRNEEDMPLPTDTVTETETPEPATPEPATPEPATPEPATPKPKPKQKDVYEKQPNAEKVSMYYLESVVATSELSERGMTHGAGRICDGDLNRAWVEGKTGQGVGESVTFYFNDVYAFSGIKIHAGYQKSRDLYYKNSRPKKVRLYFSDGSRKKILLQDFYGSQKITFADPILADAVTLQIDSVYKGSKYSDTVISEVLWY